MSRDVLEALRGLLANRTEDPGCYEFVLECWIESAADEIERLRNREKARTITTEAYEGDIVSRLRNWRGLHLAHSGVLFEEAATEIDRLRLTAEEREAIEQAALAFEYDDGELECADIAAVLRKILERTQ